MAFLAAAVSGSHWGDHICIWEGGEVRMTVCIIELVV